jgi:hypothetical protein
MEGFEFIFFIGAVVIFIALRFVMLWYFRINDMVKNQEQTIKLLKRLVPDEPKQEPKP